MALHITPLTEGQAKITRLGGLAWVECDSCRARLVLGIGRKVTRRQLRALDRGHSCSPRA